MVASIRNIIESDEGNREKLHKVCNDTGLEVYRARSWAEANIFLKRGYYDLIILGCAMPGMPYVKMIRSIRALGFDSCILVSMPITDTGEIVRCLKEGAYDTIMQPVDEEWAKIKIGRAIERRTYYSNAQEKEHYLILSIFDELTRVYNHRYFHDSLKKTLSSSKRYRYPLSILMMDLDDFKSYNDCNGHLAGDQALRQLGILLQHAVRDGDIMARYGGDEFAVILTHTDKKGATVLAERLRSLIEITTFEHEKKIPRGKLTISIGVATFQGDGEKKDDLINRADKALYRAKQMGRNMVCS